MKVLGIIAEYNPFHSGHLYHLERSKEMLNVDYTIAIMSGSFTQRGEPSIIDKWSKAKIAINNGVDLVLELPFVFSSQTAEIFAYGSIAILNSLNIIDFISFGAEYNDLDALKKIAEILSLEPREYKKELRDNLKKGCIYPKARINALNKLNPSLNADKILNDSNNILAVEYLKTLYKLDSPIKPFSIKREGSSYNNVLLSDTYSSATSIRENILNNNIQSIKPFVDSFSFSLIKNYNYNYNYIDFYINLFLYKNIINPVNNIFDISKDLDNRINNQLICNLEKKDLISNLSSKNYMTSRIKRSILNTILNLSNHDMDIIYKNFPGYIRVLGSNTNGFKLLNQIKKNTDLPVINKFTLSTKNDIINKILLIEKKATDLYFLNNNKLLLNMDFKNSPYIKK